MDRQEYALKNIFAALPRTTRAMPLVINGDPKGKNFLYCNGNSVYIRDLENPAICDVYTEHSTLTTTAKYSPSGFYIASGDQSGKLRIWDTTQKEHILKKEYQPIAGAIRDIAWSPDNQRLAVVGEGRERFGHVFLFDTGTSNGNLSGQSKTMNSIDFRPGRPLRLVSASEDNTVAIFEGPPFKFKNSFQVHSRFAHVVRYAPDGNLFVSCGADGKVFLFEGTEGEVKGELVDNACKGNAHGGGVYALSWSLDGKQLLTASGDKTCKIWDVENRSVVSTFTFGQAVDDQQLGCLWQGNYLLSVSLAGFIYYLDPNNPARPRQIIKGHNKPVTALTSTEDNAFVFSADMEGGVARWQAQTGENERLEPKYHKNQIQRLHYVNGTLVSAAMDDTLALVSNLANNNNQSATDLLHSIRANSQKLSSQPKSVAVSADGSVVALACINELVLYNRNGQKTASVSVPFEATCVAVHPSGQAVALGGQDNKLRIYNVSGGGSGANLAKELQHTGAPTDCAFSPDGQYLAACDANRHVVPYRTSDYQRASDREWTFHTARVNCLAWCPDNRHLASGSLDTNIIVWDLQHPGEHPIIIRGAHAMSQITGVVWLGPNEVASVGQDSNLKLWTVYF